MAKYDKTQKARVFSSTHPSEVSYIAHEIKFKLDVNAPFYVKYGKRVQTKGILPSNLVTPTTARQSLRMSGLKWASDQSTKHQLPQMPRSNLF